MYILEISCLSVASFAIIFSHSEGCLFTLLIVSFDVQKLLRLIRSHLFISKSTSKREVKVKVAQLCPTLCNPMDYTVHGILQARILEWVAFPFSR